MRHKFVAAALALLMVLEQLGLHTPPEHEPHEPDPHVEAPPFWAGLWRALVELVDEAIEVVEWTVSRLGRLRAVAERVEVREHVSTVLEREGKVRGFTDSQRGGLASAAEQHADGTQSFSLTGRAPQGEADTLPACQVLLRHLNGLGANWINLREGEEPADCEADDADDPSRRLRVQVVRAIRDEALWRELATSGRVTGEGVVPAVLAEALRSAVSLKAEERPVPLAERPTLHLALDATRLPGLAFDDAVAEFRRGHGSWCSELGFAAVWLIGPIPKLTHRLDGCHLKTSLLRQPKRVLTRGRAGRPS